MKILISLLLFLQLGCATSLSSQKKSFNYSSLNSIKLNETSETEILSTFGQPFMKNSKENYTTLMFKDPTTGFHRISVNISSEQKVIGVMWIPMSGEKEQYLDGAKSHFQNSSFKENIGKKKYHQALSNEAFLEDKKNGIKIFYKLSDNTVEAITLFNSEDRIPANLKK